MMLYDVVWRRMIMYDCSALAADKNLPKGWIILTLYVCDMIPENWESYLFKVAIFTDIVLNHLRVLL